MDTDGRLERLRQADRRPTEEALATEPDACQSASAAQWNPVSRESEGP